jgi:hypothetical protein
MCGPERAINHGVVFRAASSSSDALPRTTDPRGLDHYRCVRTQCKRTHFNEVERDAGYGKDIGGERGEGRRPSVDLPVLGIRENPWSLCFLYSSLL